MLADELEDVQPEGTVGLLPDVPHLSAMMTSTSPALCAGRVPEAPVISLPVTKGTTRP